MTDILDQISQCSNKVLFSYEISTQKFNFLSQAIADIWEETHENIVETPLLLLHRICPDDQDAIKRRFEKVLQGITCAIEFNLNCKNEVVKQVKLDVHPVLDANGTIISLAGIAEDVTKQAEYVDYLLEFGQKKNNVLQIVAHDLQGPLAILKNVTELLQSDINNHEYQETAKYMEIIGMVHTDCMNLITDVLKDEHFKSVDTVVNTERFDVVFKIKQIAEAFSKSKIIQTKIEVLSAKSKIIAELDEIKFGQIINNLITNSIKFTPTDGKISLTIEKQGSQLLITHADTGIGIPVALQPHLFDKNNNKARRVGLQGEKPHGIGLSIIRDLVELQGGNMRLTSEENKGTIFYLSFPLSN